MEELQNEELALSEDEVTFQVDDDQKAEWCIRKIAEAKKEMMDWIDFYVAQTDKVKDRCERRIQFFNMKLMQYFGSVPHKVTKTQESYQLPSGKLVLKKPGIKYERDDDEIMHWLILNGYDSMIKTKQTLDWESLKRQIQISGDNAVTPDGEIIPGIHIAEKPEEFKVEVK